MLRAMITLAAILALLAPYDVDSGTEVHAMLAHLPDDATCAGMIDIIEIGSGSQERCLLLQEKALALIPIAYSLHHKRK